MIAKIIKHENNFKILSIENHNNNVLRIVSNFSKNFIGKRNLLQKAAQNHDLYKKERLKVEKEKIGFYGHARWFPASLLSIDEFDANLDEKYVLSLIRLHHTFSLQKVVSVMNQHGFNHNYKRTFAKDLYALISADWIDSMVASHLLGGKDLEIHPLLDFDIDPNNFRIEPFLFKKEFSLKYHPVELSYKELVMYSQKKNSEKLIEMFKFSDIKEIVLCQ